MIPKLIFMFWKGERSWLVDVCVARVRKLHPGFEIEVLDAPLEEVGGYDSLSVQHQSDWVRICAIERYGGIWLDASCFLFKPVDDWVDMTSGRLQGFSAPFSDDCLENWAFAAPPNNELVRVWKLQLKLAIETGFKAFKKQQRCLLGDHAIYYRMPYLTMHGCYILASRMTNMRADMTKSCDGPFKHLCKTNWDTTRAIKYAIKNDPDPAVPFLKIRGRDRRHIQNHGSLQYVVLTVLSLVALILLYAMRAKF